MKDNKKLQIKTDILCSFRRAVVDASQYTVSEVELLQPVTVSVNICRNLAANWYHDSPDMDISGTLNAIQVTLIFRNPQCDTGNFTFRNTQCYSGFIT